MNYNKKTASKIKEVRLELGYSAESVATELGIAKSNYSNLENGKVEITINKLYALSHILKTTIDILLPDIKTSKVNITNGDNSNIADTINNNNDPKVIELLQKSLIIIESALNDLKSKR